MKLGIRSKLLLFSVALIGVSILAAEAYLARAIEAQMTARIRGELIIRARLAAQRAVSTLPSLKRADAADALTDEIASASGARVTIIRADGTVVGDSDVPLGKLAAVENHAARPEIVAAMNHGAGSSVRHSATTGRRTVYAAVPIVRDGAPIGTARVALPLVEVEDAISQMHRTLAAGAFVAILVAAVIALTAAQLTARRLRALTDAADSMAAGNLQTRTRASGSDEIVALGRALDQLADNLTSTVEHLRAERDLLTGMLSSMHEGVLLVGPDGRIVLTNPALRAMLLVGADAVGKSVLQVVRNAELGEVLERAAQGADSETELEIAGLRPRRVLVRAVKLRDAPGGVLAVVVDVTELRRLESVRRDFVANASHELRSPLTTVHAAAETLATLGKDEEEARARFVGLIQRNAERLANLIDDLLELSRIESRELALELEPLELAPAVERTLAHHAHRAQLKHISLAQEVTDVPHVTADRRALEHVLGNLVDNAIKYCPDGASVTVAAAAEEGLVRVRVSDTGPGIAPQHLPRLFERFYRVDAGRSRELGGTGLGLSIVKHLVEAMGGTVSIESRVGEGSVFTVSLRRAAAAPSEE